MKLQDIVLIESYSTAKQVFGREASPAEVDKRLQQFKDLNQRNILKPEEKDLSKWIKSGWEQFNTFVATATGRTSGKQEKKEKKGDSIKVHEDDKWLVVIPLTKDASCFYGKNTKWCTAATKGSNHFDSYFGGQDITMFYAILKSNGAKFAAAVYPPRVGTVECFDAEDASISMEEFTNITGISRRQLDEWVSTNADKFEHPRNNARENDDAAGERVRLAREAHEAISGAIMSLKALWHKFRVEYNSVHINPRSESDAVAMMAPIASEFKRFEKYIETKSNANSFFQEKLVSSEMMKSVEFANAVCAQPTKKYNIPRHEELDIKY